MASWAYEQFEDTKGVFRVRKLKDGQYNGQRAKGQTTIYETLYGKLKIVEHEFH